MHTTVWVITSKTRDEMEAAVRHKGVAGFTAGLLDEVDLTISRFSGGKVMDDITFVRSHWWLVSDTIDRQLRWNSRHSVPSY